MSLSTFLKLRCSGCGAELEILEFPACRCNHCGKSEELFLPELMLKAPTVREQCPVISKARAEFLARLNFKALQSEQLQLRWLPYWMLSGDLSVCFRTKAVQRSLFGDKNTIEETIVKRPDLRIWVAASSTDFPPGHCHHFTWTELAALSQTHPDHALSDPPVTAPKEWMDLLAVRLSREEKIIDLQDSAPSFTVKETLLVYRPFWEWDEIWFDAVKGKVVSEPPGKRRLLSEAYNWLTETILGGS